MPIPRKVNLANTLAEVQEFWSPRGVGVVNDCHVKLAKFAGEFVWHAHEREDELFLVVQGTLRIQFRDGEVALGPGEFIIVPRGVEHRPVAARGEVHVLLFEPSTTVNTGTAGGDRTRAVDWSEAAPGPTLAPSPRMEEIYERPLDYDLEHHGDDDDVHFYRGLVERWRPRRVLELASGSGRVTIPLAHLPAGGDFQVVGIELSDPMLSEAERKRDALPEAARRRLTFVKADIRTWAADEPFDLVIAPCSSLSHLLTLDDQVATWTRARRNLVPGGRFVADLTMPNLAAYAESMQTPPRTLLEIDIDTRDPDTGARLLRYKTTRYLAHEQRAEIRFLYDKFPGGDQIDRYVSDFDCHVYYPRELELLFRLTGFDVEERFGDYSMRRPRPTSPQLIVVGRARG